MTQKLDLDPYANPELIAGCSWDSKIDPTDAAYTIITMRMPTAPPPFNKDAESNAVGLEAQKSAAQFAAGVLCVPLSMWDKHFGTEILRDLLNVLTTAGVISKSATEGVTFTWTPPSTVDPEA